MRPAIEVTDADRDESWYILDRHIPYEKPELIFEGYKKDLLDFIKKNLGEKVSYVTATGKERKTRTICGIFVFELGITIAGPEVEALIKEIESE